MYINPLIKNLERKYPDNNRNNIVRLDMNENPGGLPVDIVEVIKSRITPEFLATYPNKIPLIESLSKYHNLSMDNIAITDGSEMALKYIFEVFGKPNSNFISISPTFEMYGVYAKMYGLNHIKIDIDKNFEIDFDSLLDSIDTSTSIVSLLNPNNPIGRPYNNNEFIKIADKTKSVGALLIIDEAYHYFYKQTQAHLLNKYNHIIILRTFSKLFSIAACRIGYALASSDIITMINNARPTFDTNSIALLFANELINNEELINKLIKDELQGRNYLISWLKDNNYEYIYDGGNFITIKTNRDAEVLASLLLNEKNIAIKTSSYDILKGYIRVSTGDIKFMKLFVDALSELDN